jgi:hypothetical protein
VWIVREIEACRRIGGIAGRVDPEGADLPIGWHGANQEKQREQAAEEQKEPEPPPAALFRLPGTRGKQPHLRPTLPGTNYGPSFARVAEIK